MILELTENDVEYLLHKWVWWVRESERIYRNLWYPPSIINKMMKIGVMLTGYSCSNSYCDNDPGAENVDEIMRNLKNFNRDWFDAIFALLMSPNKTQNQIARMLGCGRTALLKDYSSAKAWVAGALSRTKEVDEMLGRVAA